MVLDSLNNQKKRKKYFDLILAIWLIFEWRIPLRGEYHQNRHFVFFVFLGSPPMKPSSKKKKLPEIKPRPPPRPPPFFGPNYFQSFDHILLSYFYKNIKTGG
ncbi:unnamed protein product [Meganyctiphanes norvegica]|uniref:Uncharacterized protein n=1 Tax=Meganyctiphanes norvegica TaxID=48144 RepID=A0AAV2SVL5_MEGNR